MLVMGDHTPPSKLKRYTVSYFSEVMLHCRGYFDEEAVLNI